MECKRTTRWVLAEAEEEFVRSKKVSEQIPGYYYEAADVACPPVSMRESGELEVSGSFTEEDQSYGANRAIGPIDYRRVEDGAELGVQLNVGSLPKNIILPLHGALSIRLYTTMTRMIFSIRCNRWDRFPM